MSNITLKTLAKRTGFSVTTVSRALKNGPEINIETRKKVVEVANILNYQPNLYAYRLKMGKTFQLCFFLNQLDDISNYEKQIIKGIFKSLNNSNYELIVKPIFRSNQVDAIREVVEKKLADGIIISHTTLNDERVKFLLEKNFPFVTHGRTELFSEHPYFDNDHADFIDKSLTYLKKKKCEEIIFIKPANKFTYNFISLAYSLVSYDVSRSALLACYFTQHYIGCGWFVLYHKNHVYSSLCETYNVQWRRQSASA